MFCGIPTVFMLQNFFVKFSKTFREDSKHLAKITQILETMLESKAAVQFGQTNMFTEVVLVTDKNYKIYTNES
jgi:hypothetical protein